MRYEWCMGIAEIAQRVGKSRQTVAQWHRRNKLPTADAHLAMGPVWRVNTIEDWIEGKRVDH
jgi:DNA-binding transcriptional regulator YiaG